MNPTALIEALERFIHAVPAVVKGVTQDDARWKPNDKDWSILEIVRHLGDEEVDDFRTRLRLTLENSKQDWPPIDPVGWAVQRKYNDGKLDDAIARVVKERQSTIQWLRSLKGIDWSVAHHHPKIGPIHAGDLLTGWAAHDALHLRQISKRLFQIAARDGEEFTTRYAGEW